MRLVTEGLVEAQEWLSQAVFRIGQWKIEALEEARRMAVSLSPVVTGSYAASHRVVDFSLSIDPGARNTATGTPVSAYAGAVEARHNVYGRVAVMLTQEAMSMLDEVMQ